MEKITSTQNPLVKKLVQLSKKASSRKKTGQTILDGVHLCEEYLAKVGIPESCVVASGAENSEVVKIVEQCLAKRVRIIELPKSLFEKISPLVEGIGVLFVVEVPHENEFNSKANSLILENIQDPGNLGVILRSAVAFGVEQIICSPGTVSAWSPKVLRAGMGAHFAVNIFENQDLAEVISRLEIPVLATSLEAEKSIYEEDLRGAQAWIFGNEGKGVSVEIQKLATKKVIIPQSSKVESLNVAMAVTVCLSESWRQNLKKKRKSGKIRV